MDYSRTKYTLKPSLRQKFDGIIWKIETDDKLNIVAVEVRDADKHIAAFSAFDYASGKTLFKDITVADSWNWGLDRVSDGIVLLHGYMSEQTPEHKGMIAINGEGKTIWQHYNKTLHDVSPSGLITFNPSVQPLTFELTSSADGSTLQYGIEKPVPVSRDIILPDISTRQADSLPKNVAGPVLSCGLNGKTFFSFHLHQDNLFSQKLIITEGDKVILDEFLERDIQKINPEAFFIQHNHLFCIRNKKQEFVSYLV